MKNIQKQEQESPLFRAGQKTGLSLNGLNKLAWRRTQDPLVEFVNRQKVPLYEAKDAIGPVRKAAFQVYDNSLFKLCPTYPMTLLFPAQATPAMIAGCAAFRSKQRLPVLTYFD